MHASVLAGLFVITARVMEQVNGYTAYVHACNGLFLVMRGNRLQSLESEMSES
jgi:hypothetical protein